MQKQNEYQIQQFTDSIDNNQQKKSQFQLLSFKDDKNQNKNQHSNNKKPYKYYLKQKQNQDGTFDLRFQSIIKSPINSHFYQQIKLATKFQLKKKIIQFNQIIFKKKPNVLKREKDMQLMSKQNQIKMTWLGHASILLSFAGKVNILIDPVFEDRIFKVVGQKRLIQPACKANQLPQIDVVLISHDHYDHCNTKSLKDIQQKFNDVKFILGKTSKYKLLPQHYKSNQLSWTQSQQLQIKKLKIKITFVPACHWSKRSLYDQNKRLWGGFVIQACGKKIYFSGDTGMCELFQQLQQEFGYFDLSLLPIGAYEPNQQLRAQHINPKQAVQVHNIIKSKMSVGVHWGTFPMSHQTPQEVLNDFKQALKFKQSGQFIVVNIGGGVSIKLQQNDKQFPNNIYQKIGMIQV